ncbi:MAG: putative metal-dependent hydrolase YcfH [Gemmatimonadaceae bacterium]|nr:putative metal-dependent hydrolase YcfH [Gemmatimonadaceae bacterium]
MQGTVDSHAHLADPAFDVDCDPVIARARDAGVRAVISIGESLAAATRAREIAVRHPGFVYFTAGIHPHDAAGFDAARDVEGIQVEVERGAIAIGECGLDYHYDHSPRDCQRDAFGAQLRLAQQLSRPVVVHSRAAAEDTAAMVREAGQSGVVGVMHCFGGPPELAHAALDAGWYLSFAGIITFRKWQDEGLLRAVPEDRLMVETDAPYLAPVPHRGKRNEPALVLLTLARMAEIRQADAAALGSVCARNAARLFGLAISGVVA